MQASYWCDPAAWRFKTISEFKDSIYRGGEIVIFWNSQKYGIFYDGENYDIVTESLDTTSIKRLTNFWSIWSEMTACELSLHRRKC